MPTQKRHTKADGVALPRLLKFTRVTGFQKIVRYKQLTGEVGLFAISFQKTQMICRDATQHE